MAPTQTDGGNEAAVRRDRWFFKVYATPGGKHVPHVGPKVESDQSGVVRRSPHRIDQPAGRRVDGDAILPREGLAHRFSYDKRGGRSTTCWYRENPAAGTKPPEDIGEVVVLGVSHDDRVGSCPGKGDVHGVVVCRLGEACFRRVKLAAESWDRGGTSWDIRRTCRDSRSTAERADRR